MLSEEALVLYAVTGACVLLVLGVLELVAPTRSRHPQRRGPARDPWRRARTGPAPVAVRSRELAEEVPELDFARFQEAADRSHSAGGPSAEWAHPSRPVLESDEPPIERLLESQAEPELPSSRRLGVRPAAPEPPAKLWEPIRPAPEPFAPTENKPVPVERETLWEPPPRPAAEADAVRPVPAPAAEPASAGSPTSQPSLVERCYALYESQRFDEVVTDGVAALDSVTGGALFMNPQETAKLWGVVGLAREALGDYDGARVALEEAITVAPRDDRPTWERHLGALALRVGQELLGRAQGGNAEAEDRVTMLHSALTWLEGGMAAVPTDSTLRDAADAARALLWPTYGEAVNELIQRQEFHVARRVLREAMADEQCPADLQSSFRDLVSTTYSGEVGQLTAEAIKRMQEGKEEEALATLDRAEGLLTTIPDGGVGDKRRQELERRLWWSYTKVGLRRVDGGMYEEALPPLLHALSFQSVGVQRRDETKGPLVRALESIVEARSPLIQRMTVEGDRDGALILCEKLWGFLRTALDRGLTKDELATALSKTRNLFAKLGQPRM